MLKLRYLSFYYWAVRIFDRFWIQVPYWIYVSCRFIIDALYRVKEFPFYSYFVDYFYHKIVLNFIKLSIVMTICFFSLSYWCGVLNLLFFNIEPALFIWNKFHPVMVYMFLDLVCYYFVRDFCIYIQKGYWPLVFFPNDVFVWFSYQGNTGLTDGLGKFPSFSVFWKSLWKIGFFFFLFFK